MTRFRRALDKVGTAAVVVVILSCGAVVWWNVAGQRVYRAECSWTGSCRSFLCLQHALRGDEQVATSGRCTKPCSHDDDCAGGDRCVPLGPAARGDLPPFGKPDRACMRTVAP